MEEIQSPNPIPTTKFGLFLGGTIDLGNSYNWQKEIVETFEKINTKKDDWMILNPRRDNWDSSCIQSINNEKFKEQVIWELDAMDNAAVRLFVFLPDSKSPITMLELGLYKDKINIVYCPNEFYRSGNIHIVCEKYEIPCYTDWDEFKSNLELLCE